jgi:hypothetical protein
MPGDIVTTLDWALAGVLAEIEPAGETPPRVVEEDRRPPRIDPVRAARLATLSDYERHVISTLLIDLTRAGARSPPPSGETSWDRADKSFWWRWYHGNLCVAQKTGTRRYASRVNGTETSPHLELRDAQASAEITAKSLAAKPVAVS